MIQVVSACPHNHSKKSLELWFKDRVEIIPLSNIPRQPLTREYILRIAHLIHQNVRKINPNSQVSFLITGHAITNTIAVSVLRNWLKVPFLVFVYTQNEYEPFPSYLLYEEQIMPPGDTVGV